jgi:hypothetical protein
MPALRTEITEIVTGLGMLGFESVGEALAQRPATVRNVSAEHWTRLAAALAAGEHAEDFATAWENGVSFLEAADGLRGRVPVVVEWKGPHNPPGFDFLPADLRVDHVFLVSCKYLSRILANSSPTNLFERRLADRSASGGEFGWYETCAPQEYREFYAELRSYLAGSVPLPDAPEQLTQDQIAAIRAKTGGAWPASLRPAWVAFSYAVARASAERWQRRLDTPSRREEMLWRLLRLNPAPYFVLGSAGAGALRLRIATPWDWRQDYRMETFEVWPMEAGQPKVGWRAVVHSKETDMPETAEGHVEIRWSHGRFSAVEAKVYLGTPHEEVPGYYPLL